MRDGIPRDPIRSAAALRAGPGRARENFRHNSASLSDSQIRQRKSSRHQSGPLPGRFEVETMLKSPLTYEPHGGGELVAAAAVAALRRSSVRRFDPRPRRPSSSGSILRGPSTTACASSSTDCPYPLSPTAPRRALNARARERDRTLSTVSEFRASVAAVRNPEASDVDTLLRSGGTSRERNAFLRSRGSRFPALSPVLVSQHSRRSSPSAVHRIRAGSRKLDRLQSKEHQ